jgi:hypothetical protein
MRNLAKLLDEIIKMSPNGSSELAEIEDSLKYSAPELESMWWNEASAVIADMCLRNGIPDYKWQVDILSKWSMLTANGICSSCDVIYEELG